MHLGRVHADQNQGQCSCWAFSATEQLESDYFLTYGAEDLAPQQIVSCDTAGNGCGGDQRVAVPQHLRRAGAVEGLPVPLGHHRADGDVQEQAAEVTETVGSAIGYMISDAPSMVRRAQFWRNSAQFAAQLARSSDTRHASLLSGVEHARQIAKGPMSVCVDATLWQTYVSA